MTLSAVSIKYRTVVRSAHHGKLEGELYNLSGNCRNSTDEGREARGIRTEERLGDGKVRVVGQ